MNNDFVNKLMNYIDDADIKGTIGRVSDNLDRMERMKNERRHPDAQKTRAQDIHAALTADMKKKADQASKHVGLILTGGGGKGSYQTGVWKVLEGLSPKNIIISGIAGTSAGALNAALFAGGSAAQAEALWSNLDKSRLEGPFGFFGPTDDNDRYLEDLIRSSGVLPNINPDSLLTVATAFDYNKACPKDFLLNTMDDDDKTKSLLASSAFPIALKEQIIQGINYIDGGIPVFGSNMPVAPLYYLGFRKFLVIHCSSRAESSEAALLDKLNLKLNQEQYCNGSSFVHIFPSKNMGGILAGTVNFNHDFIMKNMELGTEDMEHALEDLSVFSEEVGEYDEIHVVNGKRYRSMGQVLDHLKSKE